MPRNRRFGRGQGKGGRDNSLPRHDGSGNKKGVAVGSAALGSRPQATPLSLTGEPGCYSVGLGYTTHLPRPRVLSSPPKISTRFVPTASIPVTPPNVLPHPPEGLYGCRRYPATYIFPVAWVQSAQVLFPAFPRLGKACFLLNPSAPPTGPSLIRGARGASEGTRKSRAR